MFHVLNSSLVSCEVINRDRYVAANSIAKTEFVEFYKGMRYRDISEGDGRLVERGDRINVEYTGKLLGGREIESTSEYAAGQRTITAGGSDVIEGLSEGVIGMKEYGVRELLIPPRLHFPQRFPKMIVIYEVKVRKVLDRDLRGPKTP
jgi:FKBP-type peptidyl-prolyl cis-trans isomerase